METVLVKSDSGYAGGAISLSEVDYKRGFSSSSGNCVRKLDFSADRNNSIYSKTSVQPSSFQVFMIIKI